MNPISLNLVFEDQVSEFVMIKLADKAGNFFIANSYSEGGFGYIKKNITGFNEASKGCPFFVLTDLDSGNCAPALISDWLKEPPHANLIFRVAIREVETWLLADIEGFSKYSGISKVNFYDKPEELPDPKAALLQLIKKCRKRDVREDILPKDEFAKVGPNYNDRLGEFIINHWNINRAVKRSDSLKRALHHLTTFKMVYN